MAHNSGDQLQLPIAQSAIKEEIQDEAEYEDYKYNISLDEIVIKHEVPDRETSEYEYLIKEELDKVNEESARIKQEYDLDDIIKSEEFDIKDEIAVDIVIEYECLICDATTFDKDILLSHILDHGKRFYCKICRRSFPRGFEHTKRSHKCIPYEERPFECNFCHKRFTEHGNLKRHEKVHATTKEFACGNCYKRFNSQNDLFSHSYHHRQKREKPYLCDMCDKRYYQMCHLDRHMLTHTGEKPFRCEICHKRFADNTNLTNHRRSHADERNYECKICNRLFKTSSNMINHMRVHTDERPYMCNICEKTFRKNSNLTSHKKVHRIDEVIDDFDVDTKNPRRRSNNRKREIC